MKNLKYTKKIGTLLSSILIIIISLQITLAADNPALKATLLRYDPAPAQAGEYTTVYVQIENIGSISTTDANIEFKDNYPFSIDKAEDKIINLGKIGGGQTTIVDFKVRVDEKAVLGENIIKFVLSDKPSSSVEKQFSINVKPLNSDLTLKNIEVTPSSLNPGDSAKISITLKNTEDSTLSQITSKLWTYSIQGTTVTDIPFAVEDSVSKKTITVLRSGQEEKIEYNIKSYPTIKPGIYKLPLSLEFYDGSGQNYTKTEFITLIVNPKIDAYITVDSTTLTSENKIGNVVFKIINKGFGQIQFTNLKIENSQDFDLLSPYDQVYIGSVDSDDYKTGDFKISAKKDKIEIPVVVDFKDSLNNDHRITQTITLALLSSKENGQKSSGSTWIIILGVIVIAATVWYFRRKNKRK